MTFELECLVGACALGLVHIVLASHAASGQRSYRWTASARDEPRLPLTGVAGRLERASANYLETFPFFAAAIVIVHLAGVHDWRTIWGAGLYLVARTIYLPLYAAGTFLIRSLVWNVAIAGIVLLLWAAVGS